MKDSTKRAFWKSVRKFLCSGWYSVPVMALLIYAAAAIYSVSMLDGCAAYQPGDRVPSQYGDVTPRERILLMPTYADRSRYEADR